ncbi:MAG: hypothetical protein A2X64_04770 [Ignavibacteria bacterium GWF2_33_9]|nr:MAG: hypothetical protein A2X64_04770 [Ignavibacteria bacterium GWF2_33_9]
MKNILLLLLVFCTNLIITSESITQVQKGSIILEAKGFKNDDGKARILIFSTKEKKGFPSNQNNAFIKKVVDIKNKQIAVTFDEIPFGDYAISVHHDVNGDGKVNTNLIGIPKEGLGASNDAKGNFGPPKFEKAKFSLNSSEKQIKIYIVNP